LNGKNCRPSRLQTCNPAWEAAARRDLRVAGRQLGQASDSLFALYERHAQ
jgi:hypothetical protein